MVALPEAFDSASVMDVEDTLDSSPATADIISLSPFRMACDPYVDAGYAVLPIMPGEKVPGKFDGDWRPLDNWPAFEAMQRQRPGVLQHWKGLPDAGIGIILGSTIGDYQIIALDFDTEDDDELDALQSAIPHSLMKKRGARGFSAFYRAGKDVKTKRYQKADGAIVLEILTGNATRQTVMPPSVHPKGGRYEWHAGGRLVTANELPVLEDHDFERLEDALAHLGCIEPDDRRPSSPVSRRADGDRVVDDAGNTFRETNEAALTNLDAWVGELGLPKTKRLSNGRWQAVAKWRSSSTGRETSQRKPNLSFHRDGIKDMGTGETYSACNAVMAALSFNAGQAFNWLRDMLGIVDDDDSWMDSITVSATPAIAEVGKPITCRFPTNDNAPAKITATNFKPRDPRTLARRQWLLGKFALRQEVAITIAPGGVGKTALSHVEAISLASGKNLLDFDVPDALRVWIWNGEEPAEEMERRLGAICLHYGVSADDLGDRLFVDTEDTVQLVLCEQDRSGVKLMWPVINPLIEELKRQKIDIMVIDPFVTTHNCTENDNNAMEKAAKAWKTVAKAANCAIHLVHHTRKANGQLITADSLRGGDAVASKARSVRPLNPLSVKDAKRMGLTRQEGSSIFFYDPAGNKVNMIGRGGSCEFYMIVSVPLYNETVGDLDVGDEIGVVTRWTPPQVASFSIDDDALDLFKAELASGFHPCTSQAQNNEAWVGRLIARHFDIALDEQGAWKVRVKALWKQLLDEGEVIETSERDDRHQLKKVGRPALVSDEASSTWTPAEATIDEL